MITFPLILSHLFNLTLNSHDMLNYRQNDQKWLDVVSGGLSPCAPPVPTPGVHRHYFVYTVPQRLRQGESVSGYTVPQGLHEGERDTEFMRNLKFQLNSTFKFDITDQSMKTQTYRKKCVTSRILR